MQKKTMDIILIIVGIAILIFTVVMIWLYLVTGGIPDTLVTCFFAACTGECGFMGWIKTAKTRAREREWEEEDEKRKEDLLKEQMKELQQQEENYDNQ